MDGECWRGQSRARISRRYGSPKFAACCLDQTGELVATVPAAVAAFDLQDLYPAGDISQRDRAAVAHRPAGGSSLSLLSLARSRFSRLTRASGPEPVLSCSRSIASRAYVTSAARSASGRLTGVSVKRRPTLCLLAILATSAFGPSAARCCC